MSDLVVEVAADSRWVPLALGDDVDAASAETAAEVLRVRDEDPPDPERLQDVTALVAGLSRHAREADDPDAPLVAAFALMPEAEPVPLTVASLRLVEGWGSLDDAVAALVAPAEERYDEPVVDMLDTPAGRAARVSQRLVAPDASVREWLGAAWLLADAEATLLLSATFFDLVEAAEWADAFDDLVRAVSAWVEE